MEGPSPRWALGGAARYGARVSNGRARLVLLIPVYLALATLLTWPAVARLGEVVPGSAATDLWDGLWSVWFAGTALLRGELPYATKLLDYPAGGTLVVADPLAALAVAPLLPLLGLARSWTLLVLGQLCFSGVAAHRLAEEVLDSRGEAGAGWIAGVAYASAPVLLSGVHNGNSESFSGGWAALAALAFWRLARHGGGWRVVWAGVTLLLAALGSWYGGVVAFLFAASIAVFRPSGAASPRWAPFAALALGLALCAPAAWGFQVAATTKGNLVGIKSPHEVALVRRTTGPADPLAYVTPLDYRSPDFREISRYGEDFVHCPYLGWVLIGCAGLGLRRRPGLGALALAGAAGGALSLGPVLAHGGAAVIFLDDRALPLPYLLVERLPGFRSLSLLWRFGQAPALAACVLAAVGLAGRGGRVQAIAALAVLLEIRLLSPVADLPDLARVSLSPAISALAAAPEGAVMNFPVVGGRGYLFEQTAHGKPIAGTLNFPNNNASRAVWQAMLDAVDASPEAFRERVSARARRSKVRYVVVHEDPRARPDMHDAAVRALAAAFEPLAEGPAPAADREDQTVMVRVYALW